MGREHSGQEIPDRAIQIQAGPHIITAADTLPDDLRQAVEAVNYASRPAQ